MQRPHLTIIAGCNGAGKSTYSHLFVGEIVPFDYDKRFLEIYSSMNDSDLREEIALNKTTIELETLIEESFAQQLSVCFETNFHNYPKDWIIKAKQLGYDVDIVFFCLTSIELAKERVEIRTKNNGHFVPDDIIEFKWKAGYKNINLHFSDFDYLLFLDNSGDLPAPIFEMIKKNSDEFVIEILQSYLPDYTQRRLPDIFDLIDESY